MYPKTKLYTDCDVLYIRKMFKCDECLPPKTYDAKYLFNSRRKDKFFPLFLTRAQHI